MPITKFQKEVLKLIAANRNPESYIAGGIVINRTEDSLRYSKNIDIFHERIEGVKKNSQQDFSTLLENGYQVEVVLDQPGFVRAVISKKKELLKLEWVSDSAFRFFPVIEDVEFGYRLHDADLATNKAITLANRNEVRDIVDLIQFHKKIFSLNAIIWASCGKDPGFTPDFILECMERNSTITPGALKAEALREKIEPPLLKKEWMELLRETKMTMQKFPAEDLGCIYLDKEMHIVQDPQPEHLATYTKHFGKLSGSWPRVYS